MLATELRDQLTESELISIDLVELRLGSSRQRFELIVWRCGGGVASHRVRRQRLPLLPRAGRGSRRGPRPVLRGGAAEERELGG